jgi:hypothetical protein
MAKLSRAIVGVADVLAELITSEPESWERLRQDYWETFGASVPEVTIGHLVFEALASRHPLVFGDEPAGMA